MIWRVLDPLIRRVLARHVGGWYSFDGALALESVRVCLAEVDAA